MKSITVFTPTYNRAYCLHQLYDSLVAQTNHDFMWMVIDDGSTDGTKQLVQSWINEAKIEIHYIYQENLGMHGGHNTAYQNITTELNVCIDSDDYMPANAIQIIVEQWNAIEDKSTFAGLIGLDGDKNGNIIGTKIPEELTKCTLSGLHHTYNVTGDKKLVFRTEIVNKYPKYPIFKNEKFVPLGYLYYLIDQDYFLKPINEILVIVEYQEDGSTKNIFRQYKKNPRGFAHSRTVRIKIAKSSKEKLKNTIHLISSCFFAKDISLLKKVNLLWVLVALPFAVVVHLYILYKIKN